jgi:hypothetical protein
MLAYILTGIITQAVCGEVSDMKETIAWTAKNLLLPLIPALTGALIRYTHSGQFTGATFETGELSFSMAMLSFIVMASTSRLTDKNLRESLNTLFIVGAVIFLALFACTTLLKVQLDSAASENIAQIKLLLQNQQLAPLSISNILNDQHLVGSVQMLSRVRSAVVILSLIVLPVTIMIKVRYKLED